MPVNSPIDIIPGRRIRGSTGSFEVHTGLRAKNWLRMLMRGWYDDTKMGMNDMNAQLALVCRSN